ncbi:hypothetical protein [Chitinophaga sp. LS1]|uniref:hypothetical protein n=1 Tax=Chitinophaga sp. LS1 TaxID=3051176 RepID=UPI002AAAD1C6|nr:hypothetical protein [Chitinophaga sp. LS1]WPV67507.1 hypothetical protein QQL36_02050 [Chitinophaga sp. LS1]
MEVYSFSDINLVATLSNSYTPENVIRQKRHFTYLYNYLGEQGLNAKTIVVEDAYISKDYLHDYASYYSLCFENYPKFCKRVHFFSSDFTLEQFKAAVLQNDNSSNHALWDGYLGFVVVKPIPVTVIGYTILKTYNSGQDLEGRYFWGTKEYKVHLYGKLLRVRSLAFQEQDHVLAACATTSIWTMLNKVIEGSHPLLRSPSQITKDADKTAQNGSRLFPNKGLSVQQICQSILNSGLVSDVQEGKLKDEYTNIRHFGNSELKQLLRAYSGIGIPIILIAHVPSNGWRIHALTVSGFKQFIPESTETQPGDISLLADHIEKIYVHDDQWGPFVRTEFLPDDGISTPWTDNDKLNSKTYIGTAIISVYPKIRIAYQDIKAIVIGLNVLLSRFHKEAKVSVTWDIRILLSEDLKKEVRTSGLPEDEKLSLLTTSLPRYIWVASCTLGKNRLVDYVFDATNIADAMIGIKTVCYFPELKKVLLLCLTQSRQKLPEVFNHPLAERYADFFIESLQ